jgi:hypothetical protein
MHTNAAENTRSAAPNGIETNKITRIETCTTNTAKKIPDQQHQTLSSLTKSLAKTKHAHKHCKKTQYMTVQ